MPPLNYTTQIESFKAIGEISTVLAKLGASAVLHEYDQNGSIMALSFKIKMSDLAICAGSQPAPERPDGSPGAQPQA
jgi:hypothetical protein